MLLGNCRLEEVGSCASPLANMLHDDLLALCSVQQLRRTPEMKQLLDALTKTLCKYALAVSSATPQVQPGAQKQQSAPNPALTDKFLWRLSNKLSFLSRQPLLCNHLCPATVFALSLIAIICLAGLVAAVIVVLLQTEAGAEW